MEYKIKRIALFKILRMPSCSLKFKDIAFYKITCRNTMLLDPIPFSECELDSVCNFNDNIHFKKAISNAFPVYTNIKYN